MAGEQLVDLAAHHVLFSSGAPQLQPLCRYEYRHRLLRKDPLGRCALGTPKLHHKGEFLEGTVELRIAELNETVKSK